MTIRRDDLDRRIDLSDVVTGRRLPPVHPGDILREDFLRPWGISVYALANALHVPRSRANDIAIGRRAVTADTALRLARFFCTSPDFWLNLESRFDLDTAERTSRRRIDREVTPRAA
jgi:addiction module HigA family antidote